ncbi:MAG: protein disulfide oxidoreductase [Chloroflexota bacterium]|nr:thioredoxin family protein [Chloroflexota bacterium]MBI5702190.1 thioredoxin family protein [Chloroflexota bacterium]
MERVLNDQIVKQINDVFAGLQEPVQVLYFGSKDNCDYCNETRQLLEEVSALSDKIELSVYDVQENADVAKQFNVAYAPGIVIAAKDNAEVTNLGIQFSGIPSGHEFSTLINDIIIVSKRDSGLDPKTREYLKNLDKPLHLQVFVTPTCPYCPRAVLLAHQMAMENPKMIRAEGVEATEFPELADRFNVRGVPQTVINSGAGMVVGAVPEHNLLAEIQRALQN